MATDVTGLDDKTVIGVIDVEAREVRWPADAPVATGIMNSTAWALGFGIEWSRGTRGPDGTTWITPLAPYDRNRHGRP